MKYVAFLRGINVGGHTKVEMKRLIETLEELGKVFGFKIKIPFASPEGDFRILQITNGDICSVLSISPNRGLLI